MIGTSAQEDAALALRRAKRRATTVLLASIALLIVARMLTGRWPAAAYVAALAEAATIGALADWYAVVALFRRPLGLPLPHTAIIPRNRDRIGEAIGAFIQNNFLEAQVVDRHLKDVDFVENARGWLCKPENAAMIARRLVEFAPALIASIDRSGLRAELGERIVATLASVDMSRSAAGLLRSPLVAANRQRLLDAALGGIIRFLSSPKTLGELREGLRSEAPALVKLAGADQTIFRHIIMAIAAFVDDVRSNPDHSVRREFDAMLDAILSEIETSPGMKAQIASFRDELLADPEMARIGETMWTAMSNYVDGQPDAIVDALADKLASGMSRAAAAFDLTQADRTTVNDEIRRIAVEAIARRREEIGAFVAAQVRSWDVEDLVSVVETNIGPDLQYIRLNGAFVGGLAGLAIFTVMQAFG